MKGYKVFNKDWTCIGFQYEVGKIYEEDVEPKCCEKGFHFCKELNDCFNYYDFDCENKVAIIEAIGKIDEKQDYSKCCTNKIKIIKELSWEDVLKIVNIGKSNTGRCNTGDRNTGDRNTGDRNTGYGNTGDRNTGYSNTGDFNTGDFNTGDSNTGDRNTGNHNTGNHNTGDRNTGDRNTGDSNTGDFNTGDFNTGYFNKSSFNSGCFNTKDNKIYMFNKISNLTYTDWLNSNAHDILEIIQMDLIKWIYEKDMTEKEKELNPTYKTTGGYLKVDNEKESIQKSWNELEDEEKQTILDIPNFDADIFKECTGIDVNLK